MKCTNCNGCIANARRSEENADDAGDMTSDAKTERKRATLYWLATALLVSELVLGGTWDVLRVPRVREVMLRLGYPTYFLVILGVWKLLGAVALVIPRFPRLKEWAYAGVVFNLTGAFASHVASGDVEPGPMAYLAVMLGATAASWLLRPLSRRNFRPS